MPWMCCRLGALALLGFVSSGGAEPRESPANVAVLALPLCVTSDLAVHTVCWNTSSCSLLTLAGHTCGHISPQQSGDEMSGCLLSEDAGCRLREESWPLGLVLQRETDPSPLSSPLIIVRSSASISNNSRHC